jgi:hypothetical protein
MTGHPHTLAQTEVVLLQDDTFTRCTTITPQQDMWFGRRLVLQQQLSHSLWTGHDVSGSIRRASGQAVRPVLVVQVITAADATMAAFCWQGAAILTGEA